MGKIHSKLLILDSALEETRGRALMAVRNLASHNAIAVIDSLLAQHPLPFDDAVVRFSFSLLQNPSYFLALTEPGREIDTSCPR